MKHIYFITLLPFLFSTITFAQQIYWADEVVNFSNEYESSKEGDKYFSASQILGVPNGISTKDMSSWAWVPKNPNGGKEYIRVRFNNAVKGVRQVYVSESAGPGSITKITLYDTNGKKHVVYENKTPKPLGVFDRFRMFKTSFPPTSYQVKECSVEINTKAVPGANLDAIGITKHQGEIKIRKQVNVLQYSTKVPKPENLGRQVNSNYAERLPIISPDGNTLYFTRKYHPDNIGGEGKDDIWISKRTGNGGWSHAKNIGPPLNTDDHNFVVSVNPTGTNIYLGNKYRSRSAGISISSPKRGVWGKPIDMKINDHYNNNSFVEYHVSVDEQVLLMSVERNEGFGERDLYVSFHKGEGAWTKPKNLGNKINTVNIESSVFLAADGKTLYFSSNGHYNYGGLDVFMTKRLDDSWTNWTTPQNLGNKINNAGNDYNYTIPASGEYAYFSSDDNSYGMSDLFRILLPKEARPDPVILLTGRIVDANTNQPIQGKVKYNPIDKKKNSNPSKIKEKDKETDANDDGSYQVILPYGENVEVYAHLEGYFPVSESMELSDDSLEELDSDDPNDPLIKTRYTEAPPSKEEVALEKEMARLEKELAVLKKKKSSPNNYQVPYESSRLQTSHPRTQTRPKPRYHEPANDTELDFLKQKYNKQVAAIEGVAPQRNKADKNDKEVGSMYDKLYGKKEDPVAERTKNNPAKKDDKEVNSMYDKLYGSKEEKEKPSNDPFAPKEKDTEEVAEEVVEKPEKEEPIKAEIAEETQPSFEDMEAKVRDEIRLEWIDQIKAELRKELVEEVKNELEEESANKEETAIIDDVAEEVERETQRDLADIPRLDGKVSGSSEIELELKALIIAEVKEELKEELTAPIKEELKDEVAMKVKEKEKDETQKQMDEWKKRREESSPNTTIASTPKKDPEYVEMNRDIKVVPIKVGQVIPMNNIFFDANKSSIKGQSSAELERVLEFLKKNDKLIVEVGGHTNGWCSSSFAHELSSGRAKKVRQYFIENGIAGNRIQYRGYGKQMSIATNDTLAGRKKNQRVELKILEILK
jgi:OOP family OmpA-OmpF porin